MSSPRAERLKKSLWKRGLGDGRTSGPLGRAEGRRGWKMTCVWPGDSHQAPPGCLHRPGERELSTHPEPWLRRAVPKATGFRFPSVWKPAENKPGRQGSPRASGFLEDTTASPVKVAVTGAPRESHVFRRGSRSQGPWRSQMSGAGAARGRPNRPVTQQHARQLRGCRSPLPRLGAARPRARF